MEITYDQADSKGNFKTAQAIEMLQNNFSRKLYIAAGTVLTREQVNLAISSGASCIISPNIDVDIVEYTKKKGALSIPGALTPTEMLLAHKTGADFVKVFPTAQMGVEYMSAIMEPFKHISFIAHGGITANNIADFLNIGFIGFGVSRYLSDVALVNNDNWQNLTKRAQSMVQIIKKYKQN